MSFAYMTYIKLNSDYFFRKLTYCSVKETRMDVRKYVVEFIGTFFSKIVVNPRPIGRGHKAGVTRTGT